MNDILFQQVFDILQPILPNEWKKIIFYVAYFTGSYSMKYYTYDKTGKYIDCFNQKNTNRGQLLKSFMTIDTVIKNERDQLKNKWNIMTVVITSDGKMKADFEYKDITENSIEFEEQWKKKYLI